MRADDGQRLSSRPSTKRKLDRESGQVLPFLLVWILLALLLLSVVVAIGQAVNRQSGLQRLLADAGLHRCLDHGRWPERIGQINRELIKVWERMEPAFSHGAPCAESDQALPLYLGLARDLGLAYEQLNDRWQAHPRGEAGRVTTFNLFDLFPGEPHAAFRLAETDRQLNLARQRDADVLIASTRLRERREWVCTSFGPSLRYACSPSTGIITRPTEPFAPTRGSSGHQLVWRCSRAGRLAPMPSRR